MSGQRKRVWAALGVAGFVVAALGAGCEDKSPPPQATRETPQSVLGGAAKMAKDVRGQIQAADQQASAMADQITGAAGEYTTIGGVKFKIPAGWVKQESGGMRLAQFAVAGPEGPAEVVFFGIKGTPASNIERWKKQVTGQGGQNPVVREKQIKAATGMVVNLVVLEGTYAGMGPGGVAVAPKPDQRFVGAFVELPGGRDPVQVRVLGPMGTVEPMEGAVEAMLAGALVE